MSKLTILIVEDEAIVAADLAGKLARLGYAVAGIAAQGEEAVALAGRLRPQLVLMDIWLEGPMDGIEAAEAICRQQDVPVVYLTAHSDAATLARAKLTGPFGYVLKPFDERDLATQIEMAFYRHQADRQLRQQRELLRVTLTSIGDAVIATDAGARITFVNPVAESLTGWKAEEAAGQPIQRVFRILDEQNGQPLVEPVARVLREGRAVELANHTALLTRDGRRVPIEDSAAPILDAAGEVIGAVLVFHDVTEKRRGEDALRRSETLLRAVTEGSPDPIFLKDRNSRLLLANAATCAVMGKPAGQIIGKTDVEVYADPAVGRAIMENDGRVMESGQSLVVEEVVPGSDGPRTFLSTKTPYRDGDGRVIGIVGVARDVTERKRSEEALRKSEQEFRILAEAMPQIVWATRPDGWNIYFNQQWVDYTGLTLDESYGHGWNTPFHPDDKQRAWDAWQRATQDDEPYLLECRLRRADGAYRWWLIHGTPMRGANGEIQKWFGTCTDIEERKRAEEALRESEERLRLLGDNLPDSAVYQYVHETDGRVRFLHISAGIERLNGVGVSDVLRDAGTLHRQSPPEYLERLVEAEARSKRELSDFDMELPMRRPMAKCAGCDCTPAPAGCPMDARFGTACRPT